MYVQMWPHYCPLRKKRLHKMPTLGVDSLKSFYRLELMRASLIRSANAQFQGLYGVHYASLPQPKAAWPRKNGVGRWLPAD